MALYKFKNGKLVKVAGNYGKLPDAELSETSENAVQNKVITAALNKRPNVDDVNANMLGVPSNTGWIDIAIQSGKFYYTSPTNGYIRWVGNVSINTGFAHILNIGKNTALITRDNIKCGGSSFNYSVSGDAECITCPCKAGDNIYIYLYFTTNETLKFIPAEEVSNGN